MPLRRGGTPVDLVLIATNFVTEGSLEFASSSPSRGMVPPLIWFGIPPMSPLHRCRLDYVFQGQGSREGVRESMGQAVCMATS